MQVWQTKGDRAEKFAERLKADEEVCSALGAEQIDTMFGEAYHLKHIDTIFKRVFAE